MLTLDTPIQYSPVSPSQSDQMIKKIKQKTSKLEKKKVKISLSADMIFL